MDELTLDDELYLSTKRAAKITGYAKDYVGQLCREGRVKARLVGRNWYVLDSSIREHRFGAAEVTEEKPEEAPAAEEIVKETPEIKQDEATTEQNEWNSPTYAAESVSQINVINKFSKETDEKLAPEVQYAPTVTLNGDLEPVQAPENSVEEVSTMDSEVIEEMHSAWQDWFKRKDEEKVVEETLEETLLESPEAMEERESHTPVAINSSVSDFKDEEVVIPIHRSYIAENKEAEPIKAPVPVREVEETEVYVSSRPHPSMRRGRYSSSSSLNIGAFIASSLFRFVLLIVILGSVATAVLGSGLLDNLFKRDSNNSYIIQILGGQRVIEKH